MKLPALKFPKLPAFKFRMKTLALLLVIILEGYVVLSTELLAIRITIPFVGSGTDTVSIIIAAVLMPLAFGYYAGGRFTPGMRNGRFYGVREKLVFNMMIALAFLVLGLSYVILTVLFTFLANVGFTHRLLMTALYSGVFIVMPVYLLGQTIPLITRYYAKEKLSQMTGKILFFSTAGSFLGAVFSTLVLMSTIGVHYTAAINFILLALLVLLLSKKKLGESVMICATLAICGVALNSDYTMGIFKIVENNQYSTIMTFEDDEGNRHMAINHNADSRYNDKGEKHEYIEFTERQLLETIPPGAPPKEILVIGAGAFTFGYGDKKNHYDFVDIDKSLRSIAEEYILKAKLPPNVTFHPVEARAFLARPEKKYDIIFLDAYLGNTTIPENLVTVEFFRKIRDSLSEDGVVAANFIASPNFSGPFSRNIDNTFRMVFPNVSRHVVGEEYKLWSEDPYLLRNVIYIYKNWPDSGEGKIYTDNKNTIFFDKPQRRK